MKRRILNKKRNRQVKSLKLQLKRSKYSIDKKFISHGYYDDNYEFYWDDIYFIGTYKGKETVFNCTIMSSLDVLNSKIENMIDQELDVLYPNRNDNVDFDMSNGKLKMIVHDEELEKEINAKKDELLIKLLKDNSITFNSIVKRIPGYSYGEGLNIVTLEKVLTKDIVIKYVEMIQNINVEDEGIILHEEQPSFTKEELSKFCPIRARSLNI